MLEKFVPSVRLTGSFPSKSLLTLVASVGMHVGLALENTESQEPQAGAAQKESHEVDVERWIQQLDNDDFAVREKAFAELDRRMNKDIFKMLARARWHSTGETASRARALVAKHEHLLPPGLGAGYTARPSRYPVYPWISGYTQFPFPEGCKSFRGLTGQEFSNSYLNRARQSGFPADGNPNWSDYRGATEILMKDCLAEAAQYYFGRDDFEQCMQQTCKELRRGMDQWVTLEEGFRISARLPSLLLPNLPLGMEKQ